METPIKFAGHFSVGIHQSSDYPYSEVAMRKPGTAVNKNVDISVVIPVYQSQSLIAGLCERIHAVLGELEIAGFELILVDDASGDSSWEEICAVVERHPQTVQGIPLQNNVGQMRATWYGLSKSSGKWAFTMDDDGQHAPEDLPIFLEHARRHPQCDVFMARPSESSHGKGRDLARKILNFFVTVLHGKPPSLQLSGFRLIRRSLLDKILLAGERRRSLGLVLYASAEKMANVDVSIQARSEGRSQYSWGKLCYGSLIHLFDFSQWKVRGIWIGLWGLLLFSLCWWGGWLGWMLSLLITFFIFSLTVRLCTPLPAVEVKTQSRM